MQIDDSSKRSVVLPLPEAHRSRSSTPCKSLIRMSSGLVKGIAFLYAIVSCDRCGCTSIMSIAHDDIHPQKRQNREGWPNFTKTSSQSKKVGRRMEGGKILRLPWQPKHFLHMNAEMQPAETAATDHPARATIAISGVGRKSCIPEPSLAVGLAFHAYDWNAHASPMTSTETPLQHHAIAGIKYRSSLGSPECSSHIAESTTRPEARGV